MEVKIDIELSIVDRVNGCLILIDTLSGTATRDLVFMCSETSTFATRLKCLEPNFSEEVVVRSPFRAKHHVVVQYMAAGLKCPQPPLPLPDPLFPSPLPDPLPPPPARPSSPCQTPLLEVGPPIGGRIPPPPLWTV